MGRAILNTISIAHGEAELKERPTKPVERREENGNMDNEMNWRNNNRPKYNEQSRPK